MKATIGNVRAWFGGLRGVAAGLAAVVTVLAGPLIGSGALIAALAAPAPAAAQSYGWCADQTTLTCEPTAYEAGYQGYIGFQFFATYVGVVPSGQPGLMYAIFAGGNCNLPGHGNTCLVIYYCDDGSAQYTDPGAKCPSGPPPCNCNNGGTPPASTPKPIDILSGNETLSAEDFANASRTLVLKRLHASAAQTSASSWRASVATGPISTPIGLGSWLYDFQFELQINGTAASSPVLLLTPGGAAPAFSQNSGSPTSLALVNYYGTGTTALPPNPQTDYALSIVGSWPTNLTAQSTTWTLTDGNDTVYTLTSYLDPNTSLYDIARPTKIQWRDGHSWTLAYNSASPYQLQTVTDNFGNQAAFTWQSNPVNGAPLAITSVALGTASGGAGGYNLQYIYATIGGSQGGQNNPDILTEADYLAPSGTAVPNCSAPLSGVTGVVLDCTFYQYNNDNSNGSCPYNVTAVVDASETQRWGVAYDPTSCMAITSSVTGTSSGSRSYQVAYPSEPGAAGSTFTRQVTNPLGTVSIYTYLNNGGTNQGLQLTEVDENTTSGGATGLCAGGTPSSGESFRCYQYNTSNGFVSQLKDENGNVETFTNYDPRGMAGTTEEASTSSTPRTTTYVWDSIFHEPDSVTIAGLVSTAYTYNTTIGYVLTKTVTDKTGYSTSSPRKWTYVYQQPGQLIALHGPRWAGGTDTTDTVNYSYNVNGYLKTVSQAVNATTTLTTTASGWNWAGFPGAVADPNNVPTDYTFDIHNRVLTKTVNAGGTAPSEWQYAYDDVGDVTQLTLPVAGGSFQYSYYQGQELETVTDIRGETKTFVYDLNDDPTSVTIKNGSGTTTYTHSAAYDEWGRMVKSIGASSQTWLLAYDNLSNLTQVTDPKVGTAAANVRKTTWDALNRATVQTDPLLYTVTSAYDLNDKLNKLTDARSLSTTREVDGFGETTQEVSPDRGTITYNFDADGNLTKKVDGDSVETDQTFDYASRLLTTSYPSDSAETVTYTYDATASGNYGIGRLTSVTDVSGSEAMTYDAQGRLITDAKVVKTAGDTTPFTTKYVYDANGQVTGITYPSTDALTYTRTTDGLVTAISFTPKGGAARPLLSSVTYAPFGKVASAAYGNGLLLTRTYNEDYEITGVETAPATGSALLNVAYGWQTDGRIANVTDNLIASGAGSRTAAFTYAATGRVASAAGPWGSNTYVYDPAGNLTQNGPVTMTVSPTSNRVTATAGGTARALTYETGGELTQDNWGAGNRVYAYNAADRLSETLGGTTELAAYAYDWAGHQAFRQAFGSSPSQISYLYDEAGHQLAQYVAPGATATTNEYIWLDDQAVGYVAINSSGVSTLQYVTTGQIDEPLLVTNASQTVSWNGYTDPFGLGATFTTPPATVFNLRLPGQWWQPETSQLGLSLNGARNYDPTLGRYTQADPLGIDAGPNPYAYVDGDPLNETDPSGRLTFQFGPAGNAQFGPFNVNGSLGLVFDSHGHIGFYKTVGFGGGFGADAFGGINFSLSSGDCINDIAGPFVSGEATLAAAAGISGNVFGGAGSQGQPVGGGGLTIGGGGGAQFSGGVTQTSVTPLWP